MRFSIIDLGTNSVRIDVYEMNQKKIFQLLRERVMIRLGEGLFQKKYITKNVMQRTLHTFEDFSDILYEFKVERVIAVGTSAMRVATNAQRLKKIIHKETGIQLKIISGLKEAELIAQGILSYEKMPQGFSLLVDIGGGSTEISLSRGHELFFATSLNLGAHRLHQLFLKRNPPLKKNAIDILRSYIRKCVLPLTRRQMWHEPSQVMGSSGTIKALASILNEMGCSIEPFFEKDLSKLIEKMESLTLSALIKIPGMQEKRADIILAGAVLLDEILKTLEIKKVYTTDYSLRDGLFVRELEKLNNLNQFLT